MKSLILINGCNGQESLSDKISDMYSMVTLQKRKWQITKV